VNAKVSSKESFKKVKMVETDKTSGEMETDYGLKISFKVQPLNCPF